MSLAPEAAVKPKEGVFRDWILPIVVGLGIGAGLVYGWRALRSPAEKLVAGWTPGDYTVNAQLAQQIAGLGKDAREDLLAAFRRIEVPDEPAGLDHKKVWVAGLLAGEPFFDTRSLLDIVRDREAPKWDRRAAASALVEILRKDVDAPAVADPLLEWVEDLAVLDHSEPLMRLKTMRQLEVLPPDRDERWRKALLRLADRGARPVPPDPEEAMVLSDDRLRALYELGSAAADEGAREFIWRVVQDETDDEAVRVVAIRALVERRSDKDPDPFQDPAKWLPLAKSEHRLIRQTVAENLSKTAVAAYDDVLSAMHSDPDELVRAGSVSSQIVRKRPTMLPLMDQLLEDHSELLRHEALLACGAFKDQVDGLGARQGMLLRILESSDSDSDVEGAVLALARMTGEHFGFPTNDVDVRGEDVSDDAVAGFRADAEGRRQAVEKWRARIGPQAVWTDEDRRKALEKLLTHKDRANAARAKTELGAVVK